MPASRMPALLTPLLIVSAAAPSFAAAAGSSAAQAWKAIQAGYNRMAAAIPRKDVGAVLDCMTPDFQQVEPNGQVINKAKVREGAAQSMQLSGPNSRSHTTVQKVRLVPGGAVVNTAMNEILYIRTPKDSRIHVLRLSGTSQDLWVHTGAGWKMKRSEDLTAHAILDGHPLPVPIQRRPAAVKRHP